MRFLIAADIFPPESGGPATYCVTLANELTKRGVDVRIVSLNPASDRSVVSCSMYHVSSRNKLLRYAQYLGLLLKHAKHVDVIYAMGPVNAGLPAWIAARLRSKKFVVKVVGDYAWEQWQNQLAKNKEQGTTFVSVDEFQSITLAGKAGWLKKIERFVCRKADAVITPSNYLKKIVVGWGTKSEKVQVIYNAVEFQNVSPMPKPQGDRWIVSVGRLTPWKGMETLIKIMPDILKEFPNARLKIVGDGPERKNLELRIKELRLENAVELLGNLPRVKTLSYLVAANVFVLNSGYEGLSHVLLEALGAGTHVLASNIGGNPEVVTLENVFAYNNPQEIKEKIINRLSNQQPKQTPVQNELNEFLLSTMIDKTKALLENVCKKF